ncbi:ribonuclease T [Caminibacter mediatlanticus TB-2]|uniref:Ribonuclease T n=1 Tax=Caminibacter mediatlanticus TB-2 TaxID=391592 RepID=A0AAI9AIG2_9BACT|nr:ribonuclease T [Caminibacter mediatlanticus]EDM24069.1 ribonuclease T2 [Caminibacter mediatlanticus TB-2]QCT94431.1 ribonuclease T [Caminibacter mediatlanticus TB-2]
MKKLLSILLFLSSLVYAVSTENILALSWENSFCKVNPKDKACRMRTYNDYSLTHFVLHGLWPKKKNYCSTRYKFHLSPLLWKVLKKYMPAADYLAKHEWRKHGTCFGTDAETYFLTAIKLTQEFNESAFLTFVRTHMGQYVSLTRIRFVFGGVFGDRNKRKFQLICKRKNGVIYITEIRLNLKGDPTKLDLKKLLDNAKPMVGVRQCQGGIFATP